MFLPITGIGATNSGSARRAPGLGTIDAIYTTTTRLRRWGRVSADRSARPIAEAAKESSAGYRNWALAIAHHALGDARASDEALAALIAEGEEWGFQIASVYGARGEVDKAFEWLERAYYMRDSGILLVKIHRQFESLHADPRWPRFLERVGMAG